MDSMRSLNTSLPSASSQPPQTPEALLQAFKTAALSVTNLYRSAAANQQREHAQGYQEAIEDLLAFLDKENLGLSDGEGWRVRQWAMEKHEPGLGHAGSDSEEEADYGRRARSSSPMVHRKAGGDSVAPAAAAATPTTPAPPTAASHPRPESAPPTVELVEPQHHPPAVPASPDFTFRAGTPYPEIDMDTAELPVAPSFPQPLRVDMLRRNRTGSRHSPPNSRNANAALSEQLGQLGQLGQGAGSKRRLGFDAFFDLGNGKDGAGGGGKKGRFI